MQKISLTDYEKFLEDLGKNKKVQLEEIKKKMTECGAPGFSGMSVSLLIKRYLNCTMVPNSSFESKSPFPIFFQLKRPNPHQVYFRRV